MQALKDMQFSYTSVVGHKSGNGIWSKKTTTYEAIGVAEAQASLAKFTELSEKATTEAAARQFEIALKQITSPLEALNMTISDLRDAVSRATDEQKQQLDYELKQALAQKEQMLGQYQANWFATRLSTAAASAGTISAPPMESLAGISVPNGIRANLIAGQPNHLVQLGLLEKQAKLDYSLAKKGLTANDSEAALEAYLKERLEMNSRALKTYSALMEKARTDAFAAKENTAAAEQALQEFVQAQNAYYAADLEGLQIKQQLQAEIKAKQEAQKNDQILDALTWIGEQTKIGGVEVLVLAPGQASTEDRLVKIRNNADPAGAKVINEIIEANRTVTRRR
ncbi:MAG TPA: hypothetical protein PKO06_18410 [Candidatus Ozemobacteraceae bacterium]|nr:hypothetical protein [Candidatus Ozemobacteraceae bacterium]